MPTTFCLNDLYMTHPALISAAQCQVLAKNGSRTIHPGWGGFLAGKGGDSDNYLCFVADISGDGWDDVVVVGTPGGATVWHENPAHSRQQWTVHVAFEHTDNESPAFVDLIAGIGPVLVCNSKQYFGYAIPNAGNFIRSLLRYMTPRSCQTMCVTYTSFYCHVAKPNQESCGSSTGSVHEGDGFGTPMASESGMWMETGERISWR